MIMRRKILKRVIGCAGASAIAASAMFNTFAAVTLSGDANEDSSYNVSDILAAQQAVLDTQPISYQGAQNCDMNSDGVLNAVDLLIMKRTPYASSATDSDNVVTAIVYGTSSVTLYNVNGSVVSAENAENVTVANNTYVTVNVPGEFDVSGSCAEGQLNVNCDKTAYADGIVTLNLKGLTLSNTTTSPVYIAAIGDEVVISSKNGYTNTISDGTSYTNDDNDSGAIYSCDDIKFKGKGVLNVTGNCADGIVSKNDIRIWNGTINVNAADDGIRGKDSVRIGDPDDTDYSNLIVTVETASGDGIRSTNSDDATTDAKDYGLVRVCGGTVDISSYGDGISGEQSVKIEGGDITVNTYEGSTYTGGSSGWESSNTSNLDVSCKGIKAVGLYTTDSSGTSVYSSMGNLDITGGTLNIDSTDDCLHCAGTMNITGGTMNLASADDGIHSDETVNIGSAGDTANYLTPRIDITYSYEGVEGKIVNNYSGAVTVYSTDDAYNAGGGSDSSGTTDPWGGGWNPGGSGSTSSSTDYELNFYGGYVYCNAAGDGIDSNGNITISGGYIFVSQTGGGNAPIDCGDNGCSVTYNGGVVIAGGSSDMFVTPTSYSFLSTTAISAGTTVTFTDSSGTVIATMKFSNASSEIVMCCPDSSVTCYSGGTLSSTVYFAQSQSSYDNGSCGYGGTISGGTAISSSSGGSTNPRS